MACLLAGSKHGFVLQAEVNILGVVFVIVGLLRILLGTVNIVTAFV